MNDDVNHQNDSNPRDQIVIASADGIARRIARYLAWRAETDPGVSTPYVEVGPAIGIPELECAHYTGRFRRHLYRARRILLQKHGRDMITNNAGVRATVDGPEIYASRLFRDLKRSANAVIRLDEVRRVARRGTVDDDPIVGSLAKIATHLNAAIAELRQATATVLEDDTAGRTT